ncbi:MAG: DUF1648 domain-containing protein [Saprospiraceae bacterium]|nr:DUF1648 domain-containing protein [Saprospiraceae bacterium]
MWVFLLANFSDLPEVIPQHYNAYGKADGFGSKSNLFILAGIASLLNIGLSILKNIRIALIIRLKLRKKMNSDNMQSLPECFAS